MEAQSIALVLLGGAVMDVQAEPGPQYELRTGGSVPGQIRQVAGGVARNIAEGAAQLLAGTSAAADVLLVSVVGDDAAGDAVLASCGKQGLSTRGIVRCPGAATPCVCTVLDRHGEVAASVADVEAVEKLLTPALVRRFGPQLAGASLVVLDGNLSQEAIKEAAGLASQAGVAVLYEPVSVPKAVRCVHVLHQLRYISPNAAELVAIARGLQGQQTQRGTHHHLPASAPGLEACSALQQLQLLAPFADAVLDTGVPTIILTLGACGAALLTRQGTTLHALHVPALPANLVNLSGAGDALVAGFAVGTVNGADEGRALALGVAYAKATVETRGNVAVAVDLAELQRVAHGVLASATQWTLPLSSRL